MTELSFLIDLLFNHRLPKSARDAVVTRVKEIEIHPMAMYGSMPKMNPLPVYAQPPGMAPQSSSTLAALARHPDLVAQMTATTIGMAPSQPVVESTQPLVIAQTPAAAAAMAQRQATILQAQTGKPMAGETRPRKF